MDKHETKTWDEFFKIHNKPEIIPFEESTILTINPKEGSAMEKCYEITLANDEVKTMENVETIKFSDGNLSAYNAEGDMVAHFRRDTYKYFELVGE